MIVIGPVGIERHLLVEQRSEPGRAGRQVARPILDDIETPGGSAHFATIALMDLGMPVHVVSGPPATYLSIWTEDGGKELLVSPSIDPAVHEIHAALSAHSDPVLALSLQYEETYQQVVRLCRDFDRQLFTAPNQTLLRDQGTFSQLVQISSACFMNAAEVAIAASTKSRDRIGEWFASFRPHGVLIMTNARAGLTRFDADGSHVEIPAPTVWVPKFAVGGGDMFAAIASANWNRGAIGEISFASHRASELLARNDPFQNRRQAIRH
jgi:sugar/nucleoside kinase (ribokinase family)